MTRVDPRHPANARLVQTMRGAWPDAKPLCTIDEVADPYYECGSHPDIVERVWDQLGKSLPKESRCVLFGTPALVQPSSGVVLAICMGTSYALRVPASEVGRALAAGYQQSHTWSRGRVTDLAAEYGADWVFGRFNKEEIPWCRQVFDELAGAVSPAAEMLTPATPSSAAPVPEGGLVLEVVESSGRLQHPRKVNPDAATLERTVRSLDWSQMTSVMLRRGEDDWLEVSGSTNPGDGFSAMYAEGGTEYVTSDAPDGVDVLLRLLESYAAGDESWRNLVKWE